MLTDLDQSGVSFFITGQDNLEWGVGGNITTGIVVDGFARTTEKTGGLFSSQRIRYESDSRLQTTLICICPMVLRAKAYRPLQSLGPHDGMDAKGGLA